MNTYDPMGEMIYVSMACVVDRYGGLVTSTRAPNRFPRGYANKSPRTRLGDGQARLFVDIAGRAPDLTILERTVNGQPGLVVQAAGVTETVMAFDMAGGRIKHIWAVRNPEKLRPWKTG